MKNLLFCLALLCFSISVQAQKNYTETVYLKNGSVINGIIIEQIPNESLKIKTRDGNIFVYQIDEIARITNLSVASQNINTEFKPGYKGFIDLGYSFGVGTYDADRLEFTTSHGYQINPFLYMGIGAGFNYYHDSELASVPIFANPRLTIPTNSIVTPFVDFKIGYTVGDDIEGFYFAPSAGARIAMSNKTGFNIGIGYILQKVNLYDSNYSYSKITSITAGAISLKLGIDF